MMQTLIINFDSGINISWLASEKWLGICLTGLTDCSAPEYSHFESTTWSVSFYTN